MNKELDNKLYEITNELIQSERIHTQHTKTYQKFLKIGLASAGASALMLPFVSAFIAVPVGVGALGAIGVLKLKEYASEKKVQELNTKMKELREKRTVQTHGKEIKELFNTLNSNMKRGR